MKVSEETEGIKYAGSKRKILHHIREIITGLPVNSVLDGFSGTTRVSQLFAQLGKQVTSNDISCWSETFACCYLQNSKPQSTYQELVDHLMNCKPISGWYTDHYGSLTTDVNKKPFQLHNTQKLDSIREEIENLNLAGVEKATALTSLILALDKVDNTLGHYVAYLSKWSPRSYKPLKLEVPNFKFYEQEHAVLKGDVFKAISGKQYDLVYFDPPYGSNNEKMPASRVRYNAYYHLWTSIIRNDKPELFGKAMRREDSRDKVDSSVFEEFRKNEQGAFIALQAIQRLINETNARYILLSYSSGGRATKEELYNILQANGKLVNVLAIDYQKNSMANMRWTHEWVTSDANYVEYLFLLEKT